MRDSFDAFEYIDFLRGRWKFIAVVCGLGVALALIVSLLLPKRYTATASILIEPPSSSDPRAATAVSPIYLESLKTYELFASSDSLFLKALDHFHLRDADSTQPVESMKRRVLKVNKLKDTKVLQVSATLSDPKRAQAVAQYLADETVSVSRSASKEGDQDLIEDAQRQVDAARVLLNQANEEWRKATNDTSAESLQTEVSALTDVKSKLQEQLVDARSTAAEFESREKGALEGKQANGSRELEDARNSLAAYRARVTTLERQNQELEQKIAARTAVWSRQGGREQELQAHLKAALSAHDIALHRLADLRATAGSRVERLRVIDPGIVPQRPSSPNIPLNVVAATGLALFASLLYLTLSFSFTQRRRPGFPAPLRVAGHGDD
jgi:succinoglycan biosynthesis transport protein ExoP